LLEIGFLLSGLEKYVIVAIAWIYVVGLMALTEACKPAS
jgi:hypothetical protein